MPAIPTQAEMSVELSELSSHMLCVSERLKYFGGFNLEAAQHAAELLGAAKTVAHWSRKLKRKKATKKKAGGK